MPQTLHLRAYAPIPVGHHIELVCFVKPRLLGADAPEWDEPMIVDLDTGVVYQLPWHVTGTYVLDMQRTNYPLDPNPQLPVAARVRARVLACRVLVAAVTDNTTLRTTLVIEPEPAAAAPAR
jgi:hypothetical protein